MSNIKIDRKIVKYHVQKPDEKPADTAADKVAEQAADKAADKAADAKLLAVSSGRRDCENRQLLPEP